MSAESRQEEHKRQGDGPFFFFSARALVARFWTFSLGMVMVGEGESLERVS